MTSSQTTAHGRVHLRQRISALALWLIPVGIVAGAAMIGGTDSAIPQRSPPTVQTLVLGEPVLPQWRRELSGQIEARRQSHLAFEVAGLVTSVLVDEGSSVVAGDRLARLSVPVLDAEFAAAQAELNAAQTLLQELTVGPRKEDIAVGEAQLATAQAEAARAQSDLQRLIAADTASSQQAVFQAEQQLNASNARVAERQAQLSALRTGTRTEQIARQQAAVSAAQARVALSQARLTQAHLTAPFDGVISQRLVDEGTVIQPGQHILQVQETTQLEATITVPQDIESYLPPIGETLTAIIHNRSVTAQVIAQLPQRSLQTRTSQLRLALPADAGRPGDWLRIDITSPTSEIADNNHTAERGWLLPRMALREGERGQWSCLIAVPNNDNDTFELQLRLVHILQLSSDTVTVNGALQPGDRILTAGHQRLLPGMIVHSSDIDSLSEQSSSKQPSSEQPSASEQP